MKSMNTILAQYQQSDESEHLRLGQWFVNHYIKDDDSTTTGLFYANHEKALVMIKDWLSNHCYTDSLPEWVKS